MANKIRPSGFMDFKVFPLEENIIPLATDGSGPRLLLLRRAATADEATDTLLANILKALKLDQAADCATLHLEAAPYVHLPGMVEKAETKRCVIFGYTPDQLGVRWQWPLYQPLTRAGKHYLFAAGLDKIGSDGKHKRALWEGLQALMQLD